MPDNHSDQRHEHLSSNRDEPLYPQLPLQPTVEQPRSVPQLKAGLAKGAEQTNQLLGDVKTAEWWMIGINGALLLATVVIAGIYSSQLGQMKIATTEATKATKAAQESAYAACLGAQISQQTLLEIKASGADSHGLAIGALEQAAAVTRAESAEVKVSLIPKEFSPNTLLFSNVNVENSGKTAAHNFHLTAVIEVVQMGKSPDFVFPAKPSFLRVGNFFPGPPRQIGVYRHEKNDPDPIDLSEAESQEIMHRSKWVALFGKATYSDIFGVKHWITFCGHVTQVNTDKGQHECAYYNNSDDNTLPKTIETQPSGSIGVANIKCERPKQD